MLLMSIECQVKLLINNNDFFVKRDVSYSLVLSFGRQVNIGRMFLEYLLTRNESKS